MPKKRTAVVNHLNGKKFGRKVNEILKKKKKRTRRIWRSLRYFGTRLSKEGELEDKKKLVFMSKLVNLGSKFDDEVQGYTGFRALFKTKHE